MLTSLQHPSGRALMAATLLAGISLSTVLGCARSTTASETASEVAPRQDSTGASTSDSKAVQKRLHEPIESLLKGRTSGVDVSTNPDGSISVRIRGAASFYAGTEPLYVLDGVPIQPGPRGALTGINPYDIESIEVLKGPPETTLYGVRGANGVILITTKKRPK